MLERKLNQLFIGFGWKAVTSTRGMLTHYRPWEGETAIRPQVINEAARQAEQRVEANTDDLLTNVVPGAMASVVPNHNPMQIMISKFGDWAAMALEQEGHSRKTINRVIAMSRRVGRNSGGFGEVLDLWDQFATSGAFDFRKSQEIGGFQHQLNSSAQLRECVDLASFIGKAEPFYTDVEEFTVALAMSIGGMPERESGKFAIAFAFDQNGIPMLSETERYFRS